MSAFMAGNEGAIDRAVRIGIAAVQLSQVFGGVHTAWGVGRRSPAADGVGGHVSGALSLWFQYLSGSVAIDPYFKGTRSRGQSS